MFYFLDDLQLEVEVPPAVEFFFGEDKCLSSLEADPVSNCDWYNLGFKVQSYAHLISHDALSVVIEGVVKDKLKLIFPQKNFSDFSLSRYHQFVNESEHREFADTALKRLYVKDLPEIACIFSELISELLGVNMDFKRGRDGSEHWIILRINPPYSLAYNPPHKDVYEDYDSYGCCPEMVNAWIPVVGVNSLAGLGLAPGSHLLPEAEILRSKAGAEMNGRKFSVNFIKSWGGSNRMINVFPAEGEMLCFSSHLVHGLGINRNQDLTRVALEFRLHKNSIV